MEEGIQMNRNHRSCTGCKEIVLTWGVIQVLGTHHIVLLELRYRNQIVRLRSHCEPILHHLHQRRIIEG